MNMAPTGKAKVLYMEDDPGTARLFQVALESSGYTVDLAENGDEGLTMYRRGSYDIVAVDQNMPKRDGLEVIRSIAADADHPPIVMITAVGDEKTAVEAMKRGAGDYVVKDLDGGYLDLLPSVLEGALEKDRLVRNEREALQRLRESEARHRMLVENSPVGIVSCEPSGHISEINPAARRILGLASQESEDIENLFTSEALMETGMGDAARQSLESGAPVSKERTYKNRWRERSHIRMDVVPICDDDGRVIAAQIALQDISDRKDAEKLRARSERLRAMLELSAALAKNFSNSLRVVEAYAQMALTHLKADNVSEVKGLLEQISGSNRQSIRMIRQIQRFAHARTTMAEEDGDIFDVSDAAQEALNRKDLWWKKKAEGETFELSVKPDLTPGCTIWGDRKEFVEAIGNLLNNAVDAVPSVGTIKIRTRLEEGRVLLEVQDDGIGIPKNNLDRLFEPFWTTKSGHVGMGLPVSLGIMKRHRGKISVTSKIRVGTTFSIRLPYEKVREEPRHAEKTSADDLSFRVLIIDHDQADLRVLERDLKRLGQTPFIAYSGQMGLKLFQEEEVDAVVCQASMVTMTGWEICRKIEEMCLEKGLPTPALIVMTDPNERLPRDPRMSHPQVGKILTKPVDAATLLEVISQQARSAVAHSDFSGRVSQIDIIDYIQVLLHTNQRLVLEIVSRGDESGLLFVDKGSIPHAAFGDTEGEEAVYKLLSFKGGKFITHPWHDPERKTCNKPGDYLLIESARRRDEAVVEIADY